MAEQSNPTKALKATMPGKGNKKGPAPKETDEQKLERLEKKLQEKGLPAAAVMVIQQQIDDLKGVARKASPEEERNAALALAAEAAAAAEAAKAAAAHDDRAKREAEIAVALAYVKELERQAKEAEASVLAEMFAAEKALQEEIDARPKGSRKSGISFRSIPGEGVTVRSTPAGDRASAAREALRRVKLHWEEKVEAAKADHIAVTAGKSYAVVLEERAAEERSWRAPVKTAEQIAEEKRAYDKGMARVIAEEEIFARDSKAAVAWSRATGLGPRWGSNNFEIQVVKAYRAAMAADAAAAAAPSGNSAE